MTRLLAVRQGPAGAHAAARQADHRAARAGGSRAARDQRRRASTPAQQSARLRSMISSCVESRRVRVRGRGLCSLGTAAVLRGRSHRLDPNSGHPLQVIHADSSNGQPTAGPSIPANASSLPEHSSAPRPTLGVRHLGLRHAGGRSRCAATAYISTVRPATGTSSSWPSMPTMFTAHSGALTAIDVLVSVVIVPGARRPSESPSCERACGR